MIRRELVINVALRPKVDTDLENKYSPEHSLAFYRR